MANDLDNLLKEKYTLAGYKRDRQNYTERAKHYYKIKSELPEYAQKEHERSLRNALEHVNKQKRILDSYGVKE